MSLFPAGLSVVSHQDSDGVENWNDNSELKRGDRGSHLPSTEDNSVPDVAALIVSQVVSAARNTDISSTSVCECEASTATIIAGYDSPQNPSSCSAKNADLHPAKPKHCVESVKEQSGGPASAEKALGRDGQHGINSTIDGLQEMAFKNGTTIPSTSTNCLEQEKTARINITSHSSLHSGSYKEPLCTLIVNSKKEEGSCPLDDDVIVRDAEGRWSGCTAGESLTSLDDLAHLHISQFVVDGDAQQGQQHAAGESIGCQGDGDCDDNNDDDISLDLRCSELTLDAIYPDHDDSQLELQYHHQNSQGAAGLTEGIIANTAKEHSGAAEAATSVTSDPGCVLTVPGRLLAGTGAVSAEPTTTTTVIVHVAVPPPDHCDEPEGQVQARNEGLHAPTEAPESAPPTVLSRAATAAEQSGSASAEADEKCGSQGTEQQDGSAPRAPPKAGSLASTVVGVLESKSEDSDSDSDSDSDRSSGEEEVRHREERALQEQGQVQVQAHVQAQVQGPQASHATAPEPSDASGDADDAESDLVLGSDSEGEDSDSEESSSEESSDEGSDEGSGELGSARDRRRLQAEASKLVDCEDPVLQPQFLTFSGDHNHKYETLPDRRDKFICRGGRATGNPLSLSVLCFKCKSAKHTQGAALVRLPPPVVGSDGKVRVDLSELEQHCAAHVQQTTFEFAGDPNSATYGVRRAKYINDLLAFQAVQLNMQWPTQDDNELIECGGEYFIKCGCGCDKLFSAPIVVLNDLDRSICVDTQQFDDHLQKESNVKKATIPQDAARFRTDHLYIGYDMHVTLIPACKDMSLMLNDAFKPKPVKTLLVRFFEELFALHCTFCNRKCCETRALKDLPALFIEHLKVCPGCATEEVKRQYPLVNDIDMPANDRLNPAQRKSLITQMEAVTETIGAHPFIRPCLFIGPDAEKGHKCRISCGVCAHATLLGHLVDVTVDFSDPANPVLDSTAFLEHVTTDTTKGLPQESVEGRVQLCQRKLNKKYAGRVKKAKAVEHKLYMDRGETGVNWKVGCGFCEADLLRELKKDPEKLMDLIEKLIAEFEAGDHEREFLENCPEEVAARAGTKICVEALPSERGKKWHINPRNLGRHYHRKHGPLLADRVGRQYNEHVKNTVEDKHGLEAGSSLYSEAPGPVTRGKMALGRGKGTFEQKAQSKGKGKTAAMKAPNKRSEPVPQPRDRRVGFTEKPYSMVPIETRRHLRTLMGDAEYEQAICRDADQERSSNREADEEQWEANGLDMSLPVYYRDVLGKEADPIADSTAEGQGADQQAAPVDSEELLSAASDAAAPPGAQNLALLQSVTSLIDNIVKKRTQLGEKEVTDTMVLQPAAVELMTTHNISTNVKAIKLLLGRSCESWTTKSVRTLTVLQKVLSATNDHFVGAALV